MKTYAQLLRDPRWQKKRLEIMERDDFECRICGRDDLTLNVHHTYYEKGVAPWEYPDGSMYTFCEPCHEKETREKTLWDWRLVEAFRKMGATNGTLERFVLIFADLEKEYGFGRLALFEHLLSECEEVNERPMVPRPVYAISKAMAIKLGTTR